jgi:hypothetical protein
VSHLDDAAILAVRDREPISAAELAHLHQCGACEGSVAEATSRSVLVSEALSSLKRPVNVEAAKAAVRARLDSYRTARRPSRAWLGDLARAAAVLLVAAGAVWGALPGSPVRRLWEGSRSASDPLGVTTTEQTSPTRGIAVGVSDGRIEVVVRDAAPGTDLDLLWVDTPTARISAPAGSRFEYSDGRAEVSPGPGRVTVELPRSARSASLQVNGEPYLTGSADRPRVSGPVVERGQDHVRFRVPQP